MLLYNRDIFDLNLVIKICKEFGYEYNNIFIEEAKDSKGNTLPDFFTLTTTDSRIDLDKIKNKYDFIVMWDNSDISSEIDDLTK